MRGWQKTLQPWAERYMELAEDILLYCTGLNDARLQALADAADQPSVTNCWWATYAVAPIIRDAVTQEQIRRRALAARDVEVVDR